MSDPTNAKNTTANPKSSEAIVLRLWVSFQARIFKERDGVRMSMRTFSTNFLGARRPAHPSTLAQWTNPKGKETWRIPVGRISETVAILGGTQRDEDELMRARLCELQEANPDSDLLAVAKWAIKQHYNPLTPDEACMAELYAQEVGEYLSVFKGAYFEADNQATLRGALKQCVQREMAQRDAENELERKVQALETVEQREIDRAYVKQLSAKLGEMFEVQAKGQSEKEATQRKALQARHAQVLNERSLSKEALENFTAKQLRDEIFRKTGFPRFLKGRLR